MANNLLFGFALVAIYFQPYIACILENHSFAVIPTASVHRQHIPEGAAISVAELVRQFGYGSHGMKKLFDCFDSSARHVFMSFQ